MNPIWQLNGQFFGWLVGPLLYNRFGRNVGHFNNGNFFHFPGQYMASLYGSNRIGIQIGIDLPIGEWVNAENPIDVDAPLEPIDPIEDYYGWTDLNMEEFL
ncbi:hypothetical protein [Draconibacterium orientale]|uniref:hypothetical protein n=1 Tax=Draconibacterium orientale TaxID=1168034 RepID=UPI0029C0F825|nr:hypothetical protein [Draconibacterium orientale]